MLDMKGIVFTLDALFALIIATAAISILAYLVYTPINQLYSKLNGLNNFVNSLYKIEDLQVNSSIISYLPYADWPLENSNEKGNNYISIGPNSMFLLKVLNFPSSIKYNVIGYWPYLYVVTSNDLYIINPVNFSIENVINQALVTDPIVYDGYLIYANSTSLIFSSLNGSTYYHINTQSPITTPLIPFKNTIIAGTYSGNIISYYINNGTLAWSYNLGAEPIDIGISGSSLYLSTITNNFYIFYINPISSTITMETSQSYGSVSNIVANSSTIFVGSGSIINAFYPNGTFIYDYNLNSPIVGLAMSKNILIVETDSGLYAIKNNNIIWSSNIKFSSINKAIPVVTNTDIYATWGNGTGMFNLSNGEPIFLNAMPFSLKIANLSSAFGDLFIPIGNELFIFGNANILSNNLLSTVEELYSLNLTSYANYLLDKYVPPVNYSFYNGTTLISFNPVAEFNGNSYLFVNNYPTLNPSTGLTITLWANMTGNENGYLLFKNDQYQLLYNASSLEFGVFNGSSYCYINLTYKLKPAVFYFIGAVFNGGKMTLIVNTNITSKKTSCIKINQAPESILYIGTRAGSYFYTGSIVNIQIYPIALPISSIFDIYKNGINAPPLNYASAWWLLEGDTNSYINNELLAWPVNIGFSKSGIYSLNSSYSVSKIKLPNNKANYSILYWG